MGVTAKVLDNGEVLIPAEIGQASGWTAGAEIEVETRGSEVVLRRKSERAERPGDEERRPSLTLDEFFARVPRYVGPPVSIEDMDKAVLEEAKRRWDEKSR